MGGPAEENGIALLGLNLSSKPRWLQLLICGGGFFFGYMVNGVCEEYVYNRLRFSYGWYFTFIQGLVYLGLITLYGFKPKHIQNPWKTYIKLSAVLMGSHGLTKGSLMWLNYPAQIMFKSTKVLPVMVMGAFIPGLRRKYPLHEYVSAIMLVIGLVIFTLADANTSPNFSVLGVVMVCGALVLDAFLGNLQEAIFKMNPATTQMALLDHLEMFGETILLVAKRNPSNRFWETVNLLLRYLAPRWCLIRTMEMLFCSTLVGLPFLIPPMVLTGELFTAWTECSKNMYVYLVLIFEAMATFIGQISVLCLIALFGAATTAMVTTARKALTLLLSYILFTKPLTGQHGSGLLLIMMGIVLKMMPEPFPKKYLALPTSDPTYEPKAGALQSKEEKVDYKV